MDFGCVFGSRNEENSIQNRVQKLIVFRHRNLIFFFRFWVHDGFKKSIKDCNFFQKMKLESILQGQTLPGLMEPQDMADIYLFLASHAASNITGQTFTVDRGEVMSG